MTQRLADIPTVDTHLSCLFLSMWSHELAAGIGKEGGGGVESGKKEGRGGVIKRNGVIRLLMPGDIRGLQRAPVKR